MGFLVYILYSGKIDRYYIGQTSDIVSRLARHNAGLENYTSKGVPWALRWKTEKRTRAEAVQLERKLKNLNRTRLELFMEKYSEGRCGQDED